MKKNILKVMLLLAFLMPFYSVYAKDLFVSSDNVYETDTFDGTAFIAGDKVSVNSIVNGIAFVAGSNVSVNGSFEYGFIAGNSVNIGGKINNDLFAAGNTIILTNNNITRDAYIAGNTIDVNATVGRNLSLSASKVSLNSGTLINGNLNISANEISISKDVIVKGTFKYNENAKITGIENINASSIEKENESIIKIKSNKEIIVDNIISIVGKIVIGVISLALFKTFYEKVLNRKYTFKDSAKLFGIGFLYLIGIPIVLILAAITLLLLPFSIVFLMFYILMIYFSTIVVSYIMFKYIYKTIMNKEINNYLAMIFGIILVEVIGYIPFIGSLVHFIILCFGLSLIAEILFKKNNEKKVIE